MISLRSHSTTPIRPRRFHPELYVVRRNINFNSHDQSAAALRLSGSWRASDALAASGSSRTIRRHLSVLLTASWRAPRFHSNLDLLPDLDHLVARQLEIVADLSALRLTTANSASCQRGDFKA